ncbi:mannonate dehydratase [Anaerorhabdus furcosa]|uniref:Mannonate dehydratase n=1 Tax=Anaerorhabdus furcosa TaxID=118967 RepID=A0A1T4MP67_9FIRM|nr:mannonate dehydratase [Anaerorhabdus furcosa]SJZ68518.1 mannonate dehydratase [Anaerorhabdus furcosa]
MKMTFRWFGDTDKVSLSYIKQIPCMSGVVSAIYSVQVGEVWPEDEIIELKNKCLNAGLEFEVVESVPVHEDIKLGKGRYKEYIENYKANIRLLAKHGIKCICYNFMPVFDWTRSELNHQLQDGSNALVYYQEQLNDIDIKNMSLPGWDASYTPEEMSTLIEEYKTIGEEGLWKNLEYFIGEILPVAVECDVKMAIHPDDPPWSIFGLPRIITNEENLDRFLALYDDIHHGLTLCSGSLGCTKKNDIPKLIAKYTKMKRIHFAHVRNVKILDNHDFEESAHYSKCGSLDMVDILKAYYDNGFDGYIRPDHGRMIWQETGKPGYGLYDRALGAMYLAGIWETLEKGSK